MLCQLDDFAFESGGVDLASIKRNIKFGFENFKLINAHDQWQATDKYSQVITLGGSLIKKSNRSLDELERIAEKKKAVTLSYDDGRALSVLILEINTDRSSFLKNGAFLKQDFEISLGVIYGSI